MTEQLRLNFSTKTQLLFIKHHECQLCHQRLSLLTGANAGAFIAARFGDHDKATARVVTMATAEYMPFHPSCFIAVVEARERAGFKAYAGWIVNAQRCSASACHRPQLMQGDEVNVVEVEGQSARQPQERAWGVFHTRCRVPEHYNANASVWVNVWSDTAGLGGAPRDQLLAKLLATPFGE